MGSFGCERLLLYEAQGVAQRLQRGFAPSIAVCALGLGLDGIVGWTMRPVPSVEREAVLCHPGQRPDCDLPVFPV